MTEIPITTIPGTFLQPIPEVHRRRDVPAARMEENLRAAGALFAEVHMVGECPAFVSREPVGIDRSFLWHLSISHPERYPTWDEIKTARYVLLPDDVLMAIMLPPSAEYVDVPGPHGETSTVFHLWEAMSLKVNE